MKVTTGSGQYERTYLGNEIDMKHAMSDISLFTKHIHKMISGMTGFYIDDSFSCGDESFFEKANKIMDKFNSPKVKQITSRLQV